MSDEGGQGWQSPVAHREWQWRLGRPGRTVRQYHQHGHGVGRDLGEGEGSFSRLLVLQYFDESTDLFPTMVALDGVIDIRAQFRAATNVTELDTIGEYSFLMQGFLVDGDIQVVGVHRHAGLLSVSPQWCPCMVDVGGGRYQGRVLGEGLRQEILAVPAIGGGELSRARGSPHPGVGEVSSIPIPFRYRAFQNRTAGAAPVRPSLTCVRRRPLEAIGQYGLRVLKYGLPCNALL